MTRDQWIALFDAAAGAKAVAGDFPVTNGINGRWITVLVHHLAQFWGRHKVTLLRYLTTAAIAALDAVVANEADIQRVNPPGPE